MPVKLVGLLQHVQSTRLKIDEIQEKLRNGNLELHDRDNKIRKWASNEFNVIHQYLSSLREFREKISQLEDNLSHVTKILQQKLYLLRWAHLHTVLQ